jgi:hypothetical protein
MWGSYQAQIFGRFVYGWFRSDREISDAVALAVAGGTLVVGLILLGLVTAFVIGVVSWLTDSNSNAVDHGPAPEPPDPEDRPWWDEPDR